MLNFKTAKQVLLFLNYESKKMCSMTNLTAIRAAKEAILEEKGGAVRHQGITLHLSEANTTTLTSTLHGLPCDRVDRPSAAHLPLIRDHVAQSLVVDNTEEDVSLHLPSVDAAVHALSAVIAVATLDQQPAKVVDGSLLLRKTERRCVVCAPMQ